MPELQKSTSSLRVPTACWMKCKEFNDKYAVAEELGSGAFGFVVSTVKKNTDPENAVMCAAKFMLRFKISKTRWAQDDELGIVPFETAILRQCNHPNICKFVDYIQDDEYCILIMEKHGTPWTSSSNPFIHKVMKPILSRLKTSPPKLIKRASSDLFEMLEVSEKLDEKMARNIFAQVTSAIAYLHEHNVVHGDIKDENILIDDQMNVKIIDFGSATIVTEQQDWYLKKFRGTIQYAAPEILRGEKFLGKANDVWALGNLLFGLLHQSLAFPNAQYALHSSAKTTCSRSAAELIHWMLSKKAENRPTLVQIQSHKWMNMIA